MTRVWNTVYDYGEEETLRFFNNLIHRIDHGNGFSVDNHYEPYSRWDDTEYVKTERTLYQVIDDLTNVRIELEAYTEILDNDHIEKTSGVRVFVYSTSQDYFHSKFSWYNIWADHKNVFDIIFSEFEHAISQEEMKMATNTYESIEETNKRIRYAIDFKETWESVQRLFN